MLLTGRINLLGLRISQRYFQRYSSVLTRHEFKDEPAKKQGIWFNQKRYESSKGSEPKIKPWHLVLGSSLAIGLTIFGYKMYLESQEVDIQVSNKIVKPEEIKPIIFDLPEEVPYLIIGAGTAAYAASRSIKASDQDAKILMVGDELYLPYMRPPLSKELWYTDDKEKVNNLVFKTYAGKDKTIFFEKEEYFCSAKDLETLEHGGIAVTRGLKAAKVDVEGQMVHFTNGQSIGYKKCLIATGGTPKNLSVFKNVDKEITNRLTLFRNVDDFKKLNDLTNKVKNIVIVGGGFMGSELTCALANKASELNTFKVTQIFPEAGNMGQVLPEFLSKFATEKVKEEGAQVLSGRVLKSVRFDKKSKSVMLKLDDDSEVSADHVIVSVGLDPNIDLARESGLEVDPKLGGFLVNAELAARSNLWVAGDAACFYDPKLGRRRVEHHDHAVVSGRLAGENMAGAHKPYWHQSMLWSDLGAAVGYEAIGLVDSTLPTVSVFAKPDEPVQEAAGNEDKDKAKDENVDNLPTVVEVSNTIQSKSEDEFKRGIVFYLKDDVVVGILLWNLFNKMPVARQIIKESRKFDDYAEVAKLFHLFGKPEEEEEEEQSNSS